jgi:23S rRNA (cytosine1962-C5)-methyltransferase
VLPVPGELFLRRGGERRLRGGHLWVYSNEVDSERTPLSGFAPGDPVVVRDAGGKLLGSAFMEPQALICARLYVREREQLLTPAWLQHAVTLALQAREACFAKPFYRLVYGDSDGLPGVVVDRFGPYLVMQLNSAGSERYLEPLVAALVSVLAPSGILLRADSRARREQGLPDRVECVFGDVPAEVPLEENGVAFLAPVRGGQKTGWFYDHRLNRARLAAYAAGRTVLDVYSYIGGWGIQAAAAGAASVRCVDSSAQALEGVLTNARCNGLEERVSIEQGPADAVMRGLAAAGARFDIVVLDPPAFVQRRKDLKKGITAYRRIHELGLRLLHPGGLLVAASCSMHLSRQDLVQALAGAARRSRSELRILEQGGQGPDHPVHPSIPETDYLKACFARKQGE